MSTCVLLRRTLYNYPISASLFVFSLRRTLYNYPISASLLVFYYSYFAFRLVRLVRWFRGWYCFAANLFYGLRLPIQYNARGRWPKYYAWNVKSCGVDAASQQIYFIVSGSPSNTMLGGGDQINVWNVKSCVVDAVSQQTYFIVFGSPFNPTLGMVEKNVLMGRACLTFWKKNGLA